MKVIPSALLLIVLGSVLTRAYAADQLTADIPPQALAQALASYARQTGLQLVYMSEIARGQSSQGASAGLAPRAALSRLLEGTGLEFEFLNERSVRIFASAARPKPTTTRGSPHAPHTAQTLSAGPEEIVVTATAHRESLDRVPITIDVWTAYRLEATGVTDLEDLAAHTPGVYLYHTSEYGAGVRTSLIIRGLSSDIHSANSGLYLDDVPLRIRNSGASSFGPITPVTFDVARVEVLYGPQGTLGGDGAESGSIRFFTTQPSLTSWSGTVRTEVANAAHGDANYEFGVALGGPIVAEVVGFRLSLWTRADGGYVDRVDPFTGATVERNANRLLTSSVRCALTFAPSQVVRITPSVSYQESRLHDSPIFYEYLSDPAVGDLRNGKLLRQPADDRFYLGSLRAVVDFPKSELTSLTAYARRAASTVFDSTNNFGRNYGGWGNPLGAEYPVSYLNAVPTDIETTQTTLSQELRLASADPNAQFRWLVGLWLASSTEDESQVTTAVDSSLADTFDGYSRATASTIQTDVYGQVDVRFASRLRGSAGVRVSHTQIEEAGYASGSLNSVAPPVVGGHIHSTPVAPRFTLTYAPEDYGIIYLSITKGYRLGGTNLPQSLSCSAPYPYPTTYGPDSVWSYELGAKTQWRDGALHLDGSVFHLAWQDIQQVGHSDACDQQYATNAATAASDGFDLSVNLDASPRLRLGTAVEYAHARYTRTVHYSDGFIVHAGDALGLAPYVAPPWSGIAWIEGDLLRTERSVATLRVDGVFHSHNPGPFYTQDPADRQYAPAWHSDPATGFVNCRARLAWRSFEFTAFVDNVFDSLPVLSRKSDTRQATLYYASTLTPRTIGLAASMRF